MKRMVVAVIFIVCLSSLALWPGIGQGEQENMNGLSMRLSEGAPNAPERAVDKPTASQPISEADAAGILKRLPAEQEKTEAKKPFAWPPESPPAPRTGKTIDIPFPPAESTGESIKPAPGPLGFYGTLRREMSLSPQVSA